MSRSVGIVVIGVVIALGGCATQQRQWMKVNQTYTTAEFRRDLADCTKKGELDETCMRGRGWVDVTPSKPETPKAPENFRARPTPTPMPK